jgi:hypothetical protein
MLFMNLNRDPATQINAGRVHADPKPNPNPRKKKENWKKRKKKCNSLTFAALAKSLW